MADNNFKMEIDEVFGDIVLEEGDNTSTNLRKISWGGRPAKLDIRKWYYDEENKEKAMKGVTLGEEGANNLTNALVDKGYGDTNKIYDSIKSREDFNKSSSAGEDNDGEEYYDPSELLGGDLM